MPSTAHSKEVPARLNDDLLHLLSLTAYDAISFLIAESFDKCFPLLNHYITRCTMLKYDGSIDSTKRKRPLSRTHQDSSHIPIIEPQDVTFLTTL